MTDSIDIGFSIYPGFVQLDVMAAYQVLSFPPSVKIHLIGKDLTPVISNEGLKIEPTVTYSTCPQLDVICVPGGGIEQVEIMRDRATLDFLRQISSTTKYITSVCTGSMILAAAKLLEGYKATCHWAFREQLEMLGVEVINERVVIDRNRITGAGVTSGIDLGLTLVSLIWGESMAKMAQLMMEYDPKPPFNAGNPLTVESEIRESLLNAGKPLLEAFLNCTKEIQEEMIFRNQEGF